MYIHPLWKGGTGDLIETVTFLNPPSPLFQRGDLREKHITHHFLFISYFNRINFLEATRQFITTATTLTFVMLKIRHF